jgi:thiamine kinase-like enzyme
MHELLPILRQAFPSATSCDTVASVVQANAEGYRVKFDDDDDDSKINDVFIKKVDAATYASKSWPDFRRTLMYLRTEVLFYKMLLPDLKEKGFCATPDVFHADYNLEGLIEEDEKAADQSRPEPDSWTAEGKGGHIIMEGIGEHYFQDSPITLEQAKETLSAVAGLHASAWEDQELLTKADKWLSRGSYHLKTRNTKELAGMEQAWDQFTSNFGHYDSALFERSSDIGKRIKGLAKYISDEVSPGPTDQYATLSHGDFKSMNCFLPKESTERGVILVDFASTGVGLGMSDVAMHIHHAVKPEDLENGGEGELLDHYLEQLNQRLGASRTYPKDVALRHYRLACADYFRFLLGRFWKSATPESFENKKDSKNTVLMNRNLEAALAFLNRVEQHVTEIEKEHAVCIAAQQ